MYICRDIYVHMDICIYVYMNRSRDVYVYTSIKGAICAGDVRCLSLLAS